MRSKKKKQTLEQTPCAAVILEPIQGRAESSPSYGWLNKLRKICKETKTLLIFDEVLTGLGRTGELTQAQEDSCDIICLGKTLGGGMPLSACFASREIMSAWPECKGEAIHTGTFFGHPPLQGGLITLETIRKDNLVKRAKSLGTKIISILKKT